jgi:hypothetical protein
MEASAWWNCASPKKEKKMRAIKENCASPKKKRKRELETVT